ncbi:MAG TPA: SRPBCC domain-containing protein [Longimicrobiales bacterium]|nr:SRPBCC domain-containing protein [Longimicrobiales bacterium]
MTDAAALPDQVASIHIAVPVERVWAEITKTGRVQSALYNTVLETELKPGARLRYYSPNRKRVFIVGEVVEVEPPRRFSHTYWFTMWKGGGPTLVTWELTPEADGCRVQVTHSGWTTAHEAAEKTGAGWREILGLLKQELETGTLPLKTRAMYTMMNWFLFAMPATTKTSRADEKGW